MGASEDTPGDAFGDCPRCGIVLADHDVTSGGDLVHPLGEVTCLTSEEAACGTASEED